MLIVVEIFACEKKKENDFFRVESGKKKCSFPKGFPQKYFSLILMDERYGFQEINGFDLFMDGIITIKSMASTCEIIKLLHLK